MNSKAAITLRKKANQKGEFPLAIRITKNRKSSYIYLGHHIDLKYWDSKKCCVKTAHPNATRLNNLLLIKLTEINKYLIDLQSENKDFTPLQIKNDIAFIKSNKNFFDFANDHQEEIVNTRQFSRVAVDKAYKNHIANFAKTEDLPFQDINEDFLKNLMIYLKKTPKLSDRTIANVLVYIRLIFNKAIRKGMIDRKFYPFGAGKIKIKFPESHKVGLSVKEIQNLEKLEGLTQKEVHAKNVWLFSFYLAGIRVGDVLKVRWSDIYDNRIHYTMNKNSKLVSLELPEKVKPILNCYLADKRSPGDYVFPELKEIDSADDKAIYARSKVANKHLNKQLKTIAEKAGFTKKLTMHISRHSFGNIAGDKIPVQMLQQLYRHSSVTTTMMYQSYFASATTDKALNSVVNF
ncbi:site-specific integrase [Leeuwenhoekiella parthenopeia]|uniref:Site-specific integrase n=1 Tax=Leeuwenhoekiella parthenopeia TaxID=2890320 RepID=A0ABS8GSI0_9FLAO|nr:site-specific integrase [Leeuwenhoekiella parthenopeia]MCC4212954.1 site-specific integrase [Leeuwenhoekiella parthenopeia]